MAITPGAHFTQRGVREEKPSWDTTVSHPKRPKGRGISGRRSSVKLSLL